MLVLLTVSIAVVLSACGDDNPAGLEVSCEVARDRQGEELAPSLIFEDGDTRFSVGEPIIFNMSVTNCTESKLVMRYPNAQRYEFSVSPASDYPREIWKWSNDQTFSQVVAEETFEEGETKTYGEAWDQKNNSGEQVSPGIYILTGDDLHCEVIDAPSDCASGIAVTFEIN